MRLFLRLLIFCTASQYMCIPCPYPRQLQHTQAAASFHTFKQREQIRSVPSSTAKSPQYQVFHPALHPAHLVAIPADPCHIMHSTNSSDAFVQPQHCNVRVSRFQNCFCRKWLYVHLRRARRSNSIACASVNGAAGAERSEGGMCGSAGKVWKWKLRSSFFCVVSDTSSGH